MYQRWHHLLFLHWEVDPAALEGLLPPGLTLDTYEGRAYIGLIPFTMTGIRPALLPPVPWLSKSHETNVRTYVHRDGRDPGVWFFSLDAGSLPAVWIARTLWSLPYRHARMTVEAEGGSVAYRSERIGPGPTPATADIACRTFGHPEPALPGTSDHFLLERYILYSYHKGRLLRGQVHHPAYPAQPAELLRMDESLIAAAGFTRPPDLPLVHYAREVNVRIYPIV